MGKWHNEAPLGQRHPPCDWEYLNAAERLADAGFASNQVNGFALQLDDGSIWRLIDTSGTWSVVSLPSSTYQAITNATQATNFATVTSTQNISGHRVIATDSRVFSCRKYVVF